MLNPQRIRVTVMKREFSASCLPGQIRRPCESVNQSKVECKGGRVSLPSQKRNVHHGEDMVLCHLPLGSSIAQAQSCENP